MQSCIDQCTHCHDICLRAATTHCLETGGEHARPEHLKLMFDCADICRMAADFMLRGSPRHAAVCGLCAEICEECANDCERVGDMRDCVEACRACAESCREMAQMEAL
jgi:hypothetical protein